MKWYFISLIVTIILVVIVFGLILPVYKPKPLVIPLGLPTKPVTPKTILPDIPLGKQGLFRVKKGMIYPTAEYWIESNKYWKKYFYTPEQTTKIVEVTKSEYNMQYPMRIA